MIERRRVSKSFYRYIDNYQTVADLIRFLEETIKEIPHQERHRTNIKFSGELSDHCLLVEFSYWRLESDKEYNTRVAEIEARNALEARAAKVIVHDGE